MAQGFQVLPHQAKLGSVRDSDNMIDICAWHKQTALAAVKTEVIR
jgi:hypothetical protein